MPHFQIQNDLVEVNNEKGHLTNTQNNEFDSKMQKLDKLISKFENVFDEKLTPKEKSYQYERKIMGEKIVELATDLKICQENIQDYQSAIEILCRNQQNLKKKCDKLIFQNKKLKMKLNSFGDLKNELIYFKRKSNGLVNLINKLKTETKELFETEIQEQEDYKIYVNQTITENKNLKEILKNVLNQQSNSKIENLLKEPILKEFSDNYGKLSIDFII